MTLPFGQCRQSQACGDIFAMVCNAAKALRLIAHPCPIGIESKVEEQIYQMQSGRCVGLNDGRLCFVGGHTGEARTGSRLR